MLAPETRPAPRGQMEEVRDNLIARIAEAEREGWFGEVDGLKVRLAGSKDKLAQLDRRAAGSPAINLAVARLSQVGRAGRREGVFWDNEGVSSNEIRFDCRQRSDGGELEVVPCIDGIPLTELVDRFEIDADR
jgi:uncharacterized protein with von Willebrand factor type A (vWA) domain